jgi:hypothetical protein
MKILLTLLLAMSLRPATATEFNGPYVDSVFHHPSAVPYSAGATFTSRFVANGAATMAGAVWHKADPRNTLMPQKLMDLGIEPVGWAVNVGLGGNAGDYFVPVGLSANLLPSALGPGLKLLRQSGNKTLQGIATVISSPSGGVAFGPAWTAYPMVNGTVLPLNRWRFPPGWFCGATYAFK